MRVSVRVDKETTYWADCKERWCRADISRWHEATLDKTDEEATQNMLRLLSEWCSEIYVEDVDGNAYHNVSELTLEVMNKLDVPAFRLLFNLPWRAFNQRGELGEV